MDGWFSSADLHFTTLETWRLIRAGFSMVFKGAKRDTFRIPPTDELIHSLRVISFPICHFRQINMSDHAEVCHDAAPGLLMSRLGPDTWNGFFWEFSGGCPRLQMKGRVSAARETQWFGFDVLKVGAWQKATNLPPDWKRKLLLAEKVVYEELFIFLRIV